MRGDNECSRSHVEHQLNKRGLAKFLLLWKPAVEHTCSAESVDANFARLFWYDNPSHRDTVPRISRFHLPVLGRRRLVRGGTFQGTVRLDTY